MNKHTKWGVIEGGGGRGRGENQVYWKYIFGRLNEIYICCFYPTSNESICRHIWMSDQQQINPAKNPH